MSGKIKIAICAPGEAYGGVERFVEALAECLQERDDVDPFVILFHRGRHAESLLKKGIRTLVLESRRKYDFTAPKRLAHLLATEKTNLIHANGYKATILGALAGRLAGIPVVKTEHGKLEPGSPLEPRQLRMRCNLLLDEIVTRTLVKHVAYVTHDLQCRFRRNKDLEKSSIIYNGIVPFSSFPGQRPPGVNSDSFNIGIIGRLSPVKGHRVLLAALSQLGDLSDLRAHIIGNGPLDAELRRFCREHNLNGMVNFVGFKKNIYEYLQALDLLVMSSLHEGLPYALLESMYLKIPILASNVGGLAEILEDGEDCVLVEPGNVSKLAEAIRLLHGDRHARERLSRNAYAKVCNDFMASNMIDEYMQVYRRVLDNNWEPVCAREKTAGCLGK